MNLNTFKIPMIGRLPIERKLIFGFGLALIMATIIGAVTYSQTVRGIQIGMETRHVRSIIVELTETLSVIKDAETGQRGYLLTGDPKYLAPYSEAVNTINGHLNLLRTLLKSEPQQRVLSLLLESQVRTKFQEMALTITLRRTQGLSAAQRIVLTGQGQSTMDDIRRTVSQMNSDETKEWNHLSQIRLVGQQQTLQAVCTLIGFEFILLFSVYGLIQHDFLARKRSSEALQMAYGELEMKVHQRTEALREAHTKMEQRVTERTGELAYANAILQVEVEERHRTEEALKEAMLREQTVLENVMDVVCSIDAEGRFTKVSPACLKVWGYTPDELIGEKYINLVAPEDIEKTNAIAASIVGGIAASDFENRYRHKNGSFVNTTWTAKWSAKEATMFCVARDTTERKKAEQALRENEELFRSAIGALHEGLMLQSADSEIQLVNESAARILKFSKEQLLGHNANQLRRTVVREDGSEFPRDEQPSRVAIRTGQPQHNVLMGVIVSEEVIWLSVNATPLFRPGETAPYATVSTFGDITEQKRAENERREQMEKISDYSVVLEYQMLEVAEANQQLKFAQEALEARVFERTAELAEVNQILQQSEQKYQFTTDSMPQIVWTAQPNGDLDYYNLRWYEYTGMTYEQTRGWGWAPVLHPDDLTACVDRWTASVQTGEPYEVEYRFKRASDGQYRWHLGRALPMRDEQGAIVMWAGTCTDIDDYKKAEQELQMAQSMLELRVQQRTAELEAQTDELEAQTDELGKQTVELVQMRDQALASTRAKSEFVANMSHEIRTPMNGVIGMTELLLDTSLTKQQNNYATTIRQSADALLSIINDILDFSKIEAGKMTIEVIDFDLRQLLEELVEFFAPRVHKKGLEIGCVMASDFPCYLKGDPGRLRQVLTNLCSNALKFTEQGEIRVEVQMYQETPTQVELSLCVTDTGVGIPPERLAAIFESFTQVDGSTTRKYGGTGLGLTISRQLMELMGGQISVSSEAGHGSAFRLDLTLNKQSARVQETPQLPKNLTGQHVLIVDDNATNRMILHQQLLSWGCLPADADSGEAAISLLEAEDFSLILLDMQMPGMDGEQTALSIKSKPGLAHIPIILLSSCGSEENKSVLYAKGFAASLTKPVRQSQLFNTLTEVLGGSSQKENPMLFIANETSPNLGLRILLAEDNEVNQLVALGMLEKWQCTVEVVATGRQALEALAQNYFDLVLMDVQMPAMDGLEATTMVRHQENGTGRHIPIIAMTAHSMQGDRERCLAAGMDDYVSKPVDSQLLLKTMMLYVTRPMLSHQDGAPVLVEPEPAEEIFNLERFHTSSGGKPALEEKIIAMFLRNGPPVLQRLKSALDAADASQVQFEAHSLKGSCRTIGGESLGSVCHLLETAGKNNDLIGTDALYQLAEREWERLSACLQDYQEQVKAQDLAA